MLLNRILGKIGGEQRGPKRIVGGESVETSASYGEAAKIFVVEVVEFNSDFKDSSP